jgi:hypothetical protein
LLTTSLICSQNLNRLLGSSNQAIAVPSLSTDVLGLCGADTLGV